MHNLRPELTQHLLSRVYSFQEGFQRNIALIGPPGSGKTYQLRQLLAESFPHVDILYCPVYQESVRSLITRVLQSVLLRVMNEVPHTESLERMIHRAGEKMPHTAVSVEHAYEVLKRRRYYEAFSLTLETIRVSVEERGRPCVFVIDEFQNLETVKLGHVFHELGKRVMTWPKTLFILSSSTPQRARRILQERFQLLFGQFELLELNEVDAKKARQWLYQEMTPLSDASYAVEFFLKWIGPYPWYLNVFVKRIRENLEMRHPVLTAKSVVLQATWDTSGLPEGPLYQWCRSRIERLSGSSKGGRALEVLIQVAEGARTRTEIGKRIGRSGISKSLQYLSDEDLIERRGVCWWIPDPLFRFWLRAVVGADRYEVCEDDDQRRTRFCSAFGEMWDLWHGVKRMAFDEQVIRLLQAFQDETLAIGKKTGRLPFFSNIRRFRPQEFESFSRYLIADAKGKRWCLAIDEQPVSESAIRRFDAFCKMQVPRPTRKVIVIREPLGESETVLAKSLSMWVWCENDLAILEAMYGNQADRQVAAAEIEPACSI